MEKDNPDAGGQQPPTKRRRTLSGSTQPQRRRTKYPHLTPPLHHGMTTLDRSAFDKNISIPVVSVFEDQLRPEILQQVKPFMLKVPGMKAIQDEAPKGGETENCRKTKRVLLNPELLKNNLEEFISELKLDPKVISGVGSEVVKFRYDNWTWAQILDAVIPEDRDKLSSFSHIGHILHLNLRDALLPYKTIIGEVLLDKISTARTVVNKLTNIDNTFRNFQMEILAGDPNTVVHLRENRCEYEFDFKDVYWNSRLSAEHERVVKLLQPGDVVYDVFAGVGPFAIPAGKKKCRVLANDLNPQSFKWLDHNVHKNKVHGFVSCFNQDGSQFIRSTISTDLVTVLKQSTNPDDPKSFDFTNKKFHIIMNLPAVAVEFLSSFRGILKEHAAVAADLIIIVHVYCFIKDTQGFKEKALQLVKKELNYELSDKAISEVVMVRNVAPNKEMLRVSFLLPHEVILNSQQQQ